LTVDFALLTLVLDMGENVDKPQNKAFRTIIRSARFTPEEWATVQQRAADVRLSPARFLRYVALGTPLGRRLNAEAVVALNRAGAVLNNCVRLAIRNDQPLLASEVREVLELLRERLRSLL
jgi:Mobilization protein NikA